MAGLHPGRPYDEVLTLTVELIAHLASAERQAVLAGAAVRSYRLGGGSLSH
ncbi:hypothetical protein [Kitasatospora sp. NPDC051914]|uniref:hypothetical protein n=1 Tax=Kitasatospora sp. NPDC051914 TaxID=3154945 RepID=UPI00341588A5